MIRLLLVALTLALAGCPGVPVDPRPKEAISHRARTSDGWEVSLHQYESVGPARGRPVLLCHGISANDRNMDLDADHSVARWLASQGREAWVLSLRGTGASDRVNPEEGRRGGYTLEAFAREDLPGAIRYVREKTGAESLDYVGHSMGGMIVYAYLSQGGAGLNAVVTLGSPTRLDWGGALDPVIQNVASAVVDPSALLPTVALAQASLPLSGQLPDNPMDLLLYNPENVTQATWKKLIAYGIADLSGALALQMVDFIRTGRFGSADGEIDYRKDLARVRNPVLVVAGKLDRIAPPTAVRDGYRALGGPKRWKLVGEDTGAKADYGHMDLILGERAATEVWRPMLDFLDAHATPRGSPQAPPAHKVLRTSEPRD